MSTLTFLNFGAYMTLKRSFKECKNTKILFAIKGTNLQDSTKKCNLYVFFFLKINDKRC